MTTDQNATEAAIEAANIAMFELVDSAAHSYYGIPEDIDDQLREIWQPVSDALNACDGAFAREDSFDTDNPALAAYAESLGADYVGITSDTLAVVRWSDEWHQIPSRSTAWREFVIDTVPDGAVAWKRADTMVNGVIVEPARWVYDEGEAQAIAAEDPDLLVYVNAA